MKNSEFLLGEFLNTNVEKDFDEDIVFLVVV